MTAEQFEKFQKLNEAYEQRWAELGAEKRNDLTFTDPIIDNLSHQMFQIVSGGQDHITLSAEWVEKNAEKS